nr:MAG TPA: hypothetical protein [Caudoviricetes sp.]
MYISSRFYRKVLTFAQYIVYNTSMTIVTVIQCTRVGIY